MKPCVLGGLNWDIAALVRDLPSVGETLQARRVVEGAGGKAFNQAVAAARHGADVILLGAVGNDSNGKQLLEQASLEGIETAIAVKRDAPTGRALILVDDAGRNMITVDAGANAKFETEDVDVSSDASPATEIRCLGGG